MTRQGNGIWTRQSPPHGRAANWKVAKVVDEHGTAVILKNNVPRYLVINFSKAEKGKIADNEDVFVISEQLIKQNAEAYEVLAK